ncbi:MAG: hypothetical protein ACI86M_003006, partial [Saprospiraceae bacterium]
MYITHTLIKPINKIKMKKISFIILNIFAFAILSNAQVLQAKLEHTGNKLQVFLMSEADFSTEFAQIEFFLRTDNVTTAFDVSAVDVGPTMMGNIPLVEQADNITGGFRVFQFGYAQTDSGTPTAFVAGVDLLLATITLTEGGTDLADFEIVANLNDFSTYLTINDDAGADISKASCIFFGTCPGDNLFYGPDATEPSGFLYLEPTTGAALPIKLNRFTATKGDESVNLDWSTSSEINGSHFDVQRSQNLSDWATIGRVDAVGESSTL